MARYCNEIQNPAATVNGVNAIIAALNMQNMAVVQALNGMTVALNAMNTTLTNHTTALQNIQNWLVVIS